MIARLLGTALVSVALGRAQGDLRFAVRHEPKTLNPLFAADDAAETVRYLASGVLVRVNRMTQQVEPDLAQSWKTSPDHRSITFQLRPGVRFSDGSPFTTADVAATFTQLLNPAVHSPVADSFVREHVPPKVKVENLRSVTVTFPAPVSELERLFDQLAIVSGSPSSKETPSLGPFSLFHYQPGVELVFKRNPNYWKKDAAGRQLPYLDTVHISIQGNREIELNRFRNGELDLVNNLDPESFDRLAREMPAAVHDSGPSTDVEFLWFNVVAGSGVPSYKIEWFRSRAFRGAISAAINRDDLCRVVYRGHARAALGPLSPANKLWFNSQLAPHRFDPNGALKNLQAVGFEKKSGILMDKAGHPVEFSVITNAGSKVRERMAVLIQQDLQTIGVKLNIVTLDMPSLIERLTKSAQYESCLLGLVNIAPDPNELMNVLLSSGTQHAWNPAQKTAGTPWEAEIDSLMHQQSAEPNPAKRKALFDGVQEIMRREEPYLYLVNRNSLSAISPRIQGARPALLFPETLWNIESLSVR